MAISRTYLWLFMVLLVFCLMNTACEKIIEVEEPHGGFFLDSDTAWNVLQLECLNPNENRVYHAYQYTEQLAGFRDLFLTEYKLTDSRGNRNYKLRIYTHLNALTDSSYQTTDNNYNPYDDKVYIEFYKENGTVKEELFVSELPQTENYFLFKMNAINSKTCEFRYLAKFSNPDRFAVLKGKFKVGY